MVVNDRVECEVCGASGGLRVKHLAVAGGGVGPRIKLGIKLGIDMGIRGRGGKAVEGGAGDGVGGELGVELRVRDLRQAFRQGQVRSADDAVFGLEKGVLKDGGHFAHVARPGVLEKAGERAGSQKDRALLIAGADAVEEELDERGDVFTALAERRDEKANRSEAKGEVRKEQSLAGHEAERSLRGSNQNGVAGRTVLKVSENAKEQSLSRRGEKVDAIEIGEAGKGGCVGVCGQPLASVAALKVAGRKGRTAEQIARESVLAGAVLTLNGGDLDLRCDHIGLHEELAPGGTYADNLDGVNAGIELDEAEAGWLRVEWSRTMHGIQLAAPRTQW